MLERIFLSCLLLGLALANPAAADCPPGDAARALEKGRIVVEEAVDAKDLDRFELGVVELRRAVGLAPDCVEAERALALALTRGASRLGLAAERSEALRREARSILERAAAKAPEDRRLLEERAMLASDEADRLAWLGRLAALDPEHPRVHRLLAKTLLARGDVLLANAEYRLHLRFAPYLGRETGSEHTGFAVELLERGRVDEAAEIVRKTLDLAAEEPPFERCWLILPFADGPLADRPDLGPAIRELLPLCKSLEEIGPGQALGAASNTGRTWEVVS